MKVLAGTLMIQRVYRFTDSITQMQRLVLIIIQRIKQKTICLSELVGEQRALAGMV